MRKQTNKQGSQARLGAPSWDSSWGEGRMILWEHPRSLWSRRKLWQDPWCMPAMPSQWLGAKDLGMSKAEQGPLINYVLCSKRSSRHIVMVAPSLCIIMLAPVSSSTHVSLEWGLLHGFWVQEENRERNFAGWTISVADLFQWFVETIGVNI